MAVIVTGPCAVNELGGPVIPGRLLERKFPWNWYTNTWQFSLIFKPHQIIFIHYKSRIAAVDEDDNGKFRLERVNLFD